MRERPSAYLEEKCITLEKVLDFFLLTQGSYLTTVNERLLSFLTQLTFWEWEIDNLMFSFASFQERSKAWDFEKGLVEGLQTKGILVQRHLFKDLKEKRRRKKGVTRVVAPFAHLNKVIEKWNRLLKASEERILLPRSELERVSSFGAQTLLDLSRFRRTLTV